MTSANSKKIKKSLTLNSKSESDKFEGTNPEEFEIEYHRASPRTTSSEQPQQRKSNSTPPSPIRSSVRQLQASPRRIEYHQASAITLSLESQQRKPYGTSPSSIRSSAHQIQASPRKVQQNRNFLPTQSPETPHQRKTYGTSPSPSRSSLYQIQASPRRMQQNRGLPPTSPSEHFHQRKPYGTTPSPIRSPTHQIQASPQKVQQNRGLPPTLSSEQLQQRKSYGTAPPLTRSSARQIQASPRRKEHNQVSVSTLSPEQTRQKKSSGISPGRKHTEVNLNEPPLTFNMFNSLFEEPTQTKALKSDFQRMLMNDETHPVSVMGTEYKIKKKWITLLLIFCLVGTMFITYVMVNALSESYSSSYESDSVMGIYSAGAIATDAPPCADVAKTIIVRGGTVVDAAIAGMLCSGVYNFQGAGIGGGFFMVFYNRTTKVAKVIDARPAAPEQISLRKISKMKGASHPRSLTGGISVSVPGEIKGFWLAHRRFGRLSWREVFQPAIELSMKGFELSAKAAKLIKNNVRSIEGSETIRELLTNSETNDLKEEGDLIQLPCLGRTLGLIASRGQGEFYAGGTGKKFTEDIQKKGSRISFEDLKRYRAILKTATPQKINEKMIVYSVYPPGSGYLLGFVLSLLEGFKFNEEKMNSIEEAVLTYHRIIESFKQSIGFRNCLGDEIDENMDTLTKILTTDIEIIACRQRINDSTTFNMTYYLQDCLQFQLDSGTSHVSIIGPNGDAVSISSSINCWFGAGFISNTTGIIPNNDLDNFSFNLNPRKSQSTDEVKKKPKTPIPSILNKDLRKWPNRPLSAKRALSSMCPAVIVDDKGDAIMAIGAGGGSQILTAMVQVILYTFKFGKTLKEAIDTGRLHHQLYPNVLEYESTFPKEILYGLQSRNHSIKKMSENKRSAVIAVYRNPSGQYFANYDYRRDGSVAGFDYFVDYSKNSSDCHKCSPVVDFSFVQDARRWRCRNCRDKFDLCIWCYDEPGDCYFCPLIMIDNCVYCDGPHCISCLKEIRYSLKDRKAKAKCVKCPLI